MSLTFFALLVGVLAVLAASGGLIVWLVAPPRPVPPQRARGQGVGRRLVTILAVGALAAGAIALFTPSRHVSPPPEPKRMDRMSARDLQRYAAENGIFGGAAAGQKALAAELKGIGPTVLASAPVRPDDADDPRPGTAVRIARVRSTTPHFSREKALADAVLVARDKLADRLAALDPPVHEVPSFEVIRRDYVRPESVTDVLPTQDVKDEWKKAGLGENRQWVEIDVEVSDRQLRELRAKDRATDGGLVVGAAAVAFAGLFAFLRLDAWTKGYLTMMLAFGAAAVVGGAVALLAWVR